MAGVLSGGCRTQPVLRNPARQQTSQRTPNLTGEILTQEVDMPIGFCFSNRRGKTSVAGAFFVEHGGTSCDCGYEPGRQLGVSLVNELKQFTFCEPLLESSANYRPIMTPKERTINPSMYPPAFLAHKKFVRRNPLV